MVLKCQLLADLAAFFLFLLTVTDIESQLNYKRARLSVKEIFHRLLDFANSSWFAAAVRSVLRLFMPKPGICNDV